MKLVLLTLVALVVLVSSKSSLALAPTGPTTPAPTMEQRVKELENILHGLSRQVMLQQFFVEEKIRSDGNSGLKQTRVTSDGTKNYYQTAHIGGNRFMAVHDHANYDRTVGLGELMPVMNGVEFRTRHNDYKLKMPSTTNQNYDGTEPIPFPDVPPSVLNKKTVDEQIQEMREYFLAFKNQNTTHRDYKPYFKPVLCYIEGAWTLNTKTLDEPFQSDRHAIDADSWFDLMDKIRYTSYSGSKSVLENFAYLPTTIISVEDGRPLYAQWNYRILCHPIQKDLPTSYFKQEDDLMFRFPNRVQMGQMVNSRAQRFKLNEKNFDHHDSGKSLLDNLMWEIPGKDNYMANLTDNSFGMVLEDVRYSNHTLINTGFYHRYFKTLDKGAMGTKAVHRGYSDGNLFVAQTSQPRVAPMAVSNCHRVGTGRHRHQECTQFSSRYTYALPIEIIYMTPLFQWNPYDVPEYDFQTMKGYGRRLGGTTPESAYNGTNYKGFFYRTPSEFYSSGRVQKDAADTAKKGAGILDKSGQVRILASSGVRIVTPDIEGVGAVRLRYPIMPIYGEGSGVWKELNALKDMTMHMNRYASLFEERPGQMSSTNGTDSAGALLHFRMSTTHQDPPGEHMHEFFITKEELDEVKHGQHITITTSEDMGHSHELLLTMRRGHLGIRRCDGVTHCWDGHSNSLYSVTT